MAGEDQSVEQEVSHDLEEQELSKVLKAIIGAHMGKTSRSVDGDIAKSWERAISLPHNSAGGENEVGVGELRVTSFPDRYGAKPSEDNQTTLGFAELRLKDKDRTSLDFTLRRDSAEVSEQRRLLGIPFGSRTRINSSLSWEIIGIRDPRPGEKNYRDGKFDRKWDKVNLSRDEAVALWIKWLPAIRSMGTISRLVQQVNPQ